MNWHSHGVLLMGIWESAIPGLSGFRRVLLLIWHLRIDCPRKRPITQNSHYLKH